MTALLFFLCILNIGLGVLNIFAFSCIGNHIAGAVAFFAGGFVAAVLILTSH